jgi:hypothetical protein
MDKSLRETAASRLKNKSVPYYFVESILGTSSYFNPMRKPFYEQFDVYYLVISPLQLSSMILVDWEYPEGREFSHFYEEDDLQ